MSDKLREAAKAALDWLENTKTQSMEEYLQVVNGLRAALAEPAIKESLTVAEQKPVAWMSDSDVGFYKEEFGNYPCVPLYTAPPRREWVGLTDEEINLIYDRPHIYFTQYAKDIEAKLREKNT